MGRGKPPGAAAPVEAPRRPQQFHAVGGVAGFEAVEGWFRTTAADIAREAERTDTQTSGDWWRRGGFDRIEKYDDRIQLFATRLADGRHEFSYLVRATTSGTFRAAGSWAEEMYSPEVSGRSAPVVIEIK